VDVIKRGDLNVGHEIADSAVFIADLNWKLVQARCGRARQCNDQINFSRFAWEQRSDKGLRGEGFARQQSRSSLNFFDYFLIVLNLYNYFKRNFD
jgi:hypothetical protein